MAVFQITYDLHRPHQQYAELIKAIEETFPTHWHFQLSSWIISSTWNAAQIRDWLGKHIDSDDLLFVARLSGDWAALGMSDKGGAWINNLSF